METNLRNLIDLHNECHVDQCNLNELKSLLSEKKSRLRTTAIECIADHVKNYGKGEDKEITLNKEIECVVYEGYDYSTEPTDSDVLDYEAKVTNLYLVDNDVYVAGKENSYLEAAIEQLSNKALIDVYDAICETFNIN